ncbi:hypothetical protein [Streptomyces sp. HUAS TT3]|uniref:hypothetical protein n=1 Tax=Streptomyces sp. HUAS TT3 TaxID=3447510 RepID=UPI003F65DE9B
MAHRGATLVWSPLSKLLLYGRTADAAVAKAAGLGISLTPTGRPVCWPTRKQPQLSVPIP